MGAVTQQARAVTAIAGGNVSVINNVQVLGSLSLDMGTTASFQDILQIVINNNTPGGFVLDFVAAYGGEFARAGVDQTGVNFSALRLTDGPTGTLGAGATAINNGVAQSYTLDLVTGAGGQTIAATMDWTSGPQTTATDQYVCELEASWTGVSPLAGLYTESFTITLTAVP